MSYQVAEELIIKMRKRAIITLMVLVLAIGISLLVSTEAKIYKQHSIINLKIPCSYNGTFCSSSALCNITVEYPNSSAMLDEAGMTSSGNGMPNYTLSDSTITGTYQFTTLCCQAGYCDDYSSTFEINKLGEELTTYSGIVYAIVLVVSIFIFLLSLYGTMKIKWKNNRDDDGRVISINDVKYVKLALAYITYLIGVWIAFLAHGVADKYLLMDGASRFFYLIYWALLSFLFPIFVVMLIFMLIIVAQDKKIEKMIQRGLPVR